MSTLYLIRHGQASFGAEDYDVLSALGAEQARTLGAFWADRGVRIDACYTGPLRRQTGTARHLLASAREAGAAYPEPVVLAELDEYPAFELAARSLPILTAQDPELAALWSSRAASAEGDSRAREERLARAFEALVLRWARGELDTGDLETFAQFVGRVRRGLGHIMETEGRGKRVAVVTSGGPIGVAMAMALGLGDEQSMRVAWTVGNAAVTEFRYREPHRLSLLRFNTIPHLPDPALVTYR